MSKKEDFVASIASGYNPKGESITMGAAMLDGTAITGSHVKIPLKTMNRHTAILERIGQRIHVPR